MRRFSERARDELYWLAAMVWALTWILAIEIVVRWDDWRLGKKRSPAPNPAGRTGTFLHRKAT